MSEQVLVCGSIAFDTIAVFEGHFKDHILPDNIQSLSVSFLVPTMRKEYGGCAGNIAYKLLSSFGGAEAIGPVLLGMRKPVTVLQRNSAVDSIVHMTAITAAAAVRQASTPRAATVPPPRPTSDMAGFQAPK